MFQPGQLHQLEDSNSLNARLRMFSLAQLKVAETQTPIIFTTGKDY